MKSVLSKTAWFLLAMIATTFGAMNIARGWMSDNGDGTYTNPVLNGDYPDPDIIRVGNDYYLATTTFVSVPSLEILSSKDLINWKITGYALPSLTFDPKYSMVGGTEYSHGIWAPSLRYHNGIFYVVDCIQGHGTIVCRAPNPVGPWTMNDLGAYLYDPGLMFDDDGTPLIYNGTGGHISVATLTMDLTKVISNVPALTAETGEGSHAYKINGAYYIFNSVYGPDPTLICSRSVNKGGPFTTTTVCNNHVPWSGPHQGGIVQLPNGDWWGFSLSDSGSMGRTLWVGPVQWSDGWPYFGNAAEPSISITNRKPATGTFSAIHLPTSDDFSGSKLRLQWQWNHNPDNSMWSLTKRKGFLRLYTETAPHLTTARNTLTLRTEAPGCEGTIKVDTRGLANGDLAGLSLFEQYFGYVAVSKTADGESIVQVTNKNGDLVNPSEDILSTTTVSPQSSVWLRVTCDFTKNLATFSYSLDGTSYTDIGPPFRMHFTLATFQGERFGIFDYNPSPSAGWLDVDYFHETLFGDKLPQSP